MFVMTFAHNCRPDVEFLPLCLLLQAVLSPMQAVQPRKKATPPQRLLAVHDRLGLWLLEWLLHGVSAMKIVWGDLDLKRFARDAIPVSTSITDIGFQRCNHCFINPRFLCYAPVRHPYMRHMCARCTITILATILTPFNLPCRLMHMSAWCVGLATRG